MIVCTVVTFHANPPHNLTRTRPTNNIFMVTKVSPAAAAVCRCCAASAQSSALVAQCFETLFSVMLALLTQHAEQVRLCLAALGPALRYMLLTVAGLGPAHGAAPGGAPSQRSETESAAGTNEKEEGTVVVPVAPRLKYAERLARLYEALVSMSSAFRKQVVYVLAGESSGCFYFVWMIHILFSFCY